jgi:undecaprenyl diphosphate synthase
LKKQLNSSIVVVMVSKKLHLAIVPDGNRRWARREKKLPWMGHRAALENCRTLLEWCRQEPRLGVLTVWGFSTENWKRDREEVILLMQLFEWFLRRELPTLSQRGIRLLTSGRKDRLPRTLTHLLMQAERTTAQLTDFTLHMALDYGGQDEVTRAVNKLTKTGSATIEDIQKNLDQPDLPPIDIIVRTSGEQRTSNFFMWQATYAEWFFLNKFFPELTPEDLRQIINDFSQRSRRFGA